MNNVWVPAWIPDWLARIWPEPPVFATVFLLAFFFLFVVINLRFGGLLAPQDRR